MANRFDRFLVGLGGGQVPQEGQELTPQQVGMRNRALLNAAQAILEQGERKDGEKTGGLLVRLGTAGLNEFADEYQTEIKDQQTAKIADMNYQLKKMEFDKAMDLEAARKTAPAYSKLHTPGGNMTNEYAQWLRDTARHYRMRGFNKQADEYLSRLPVGTAQQRAETILKEKGRHYKAKAKLLEARKNLGVIEGLLRQGSGTADLAALMTAIKNIDDSVVRESEARAFGAAQGALNQAYNAARRLNDGTYTLDTAFNIYQLAVETYKVAEESYGFMVKDEIESYNRVLMDPTIGQEIVNPLAPAPFGLMTRDQLGSARGKDKDTDWDNL